MKRASISAQLCIEATETRSSMPWYDSPRGPKHTVGMPERMKWRASVVAVAGLSAGGLPWTLS
jgi:hypothetical protein